MPRFYPTGTNTSTGMTVVGAGTAHEAVSDGSDSSYVSLALSALTGSVLFDFSWTPEIETGDVSVVITARFAYPPTPTNVDGVEGFIFDFGPGGTPTWEIPGTQSSPTTLSTVTAAKSTDLLNVQLQRRGTGGTPSGTLRVYEFYVDVNPQSPQASDLRAGI